MKMLTAAEVTAMKAEAFRSGFHACRTQAIDICRGVDGKTFPKNGYECADQIITLEPTEGDING